MVVERALSVNIARPINKKPTKADIETLVAVHVDLDLDQQQNLVRRIYGAGDGRLRHDNDTLGLLGTMFRRLFKPSAD